MFLFAEPLNLWKRKEKRSKKQGKSEKGERKQGNRKKKKQKKQGFLTRGFGTSARGNNIPKEACQNPVFLNPAFQGSSCIHCAALHGLTLPRNCMISQSFEPSRGRAAKVLVQKLLRAVEAEKQGLKNRVWPQRRRTNVQQRTCKIDLPSSFYYLFFSFVLIELKPFVLKGKVLGEKF